MTKETEITVTYIFKKKIIGWIVACDIMEMSIHKGIRGWGFTQRMAIGSLNKKWNKLATKDHKRILKLSAVNPLISTFSMKLVLKKESLL